MIDTIKNLFNDLNVEISKLEKRVNKLEKENELYRNALGLVNNVQELETLTFIQIKPEYRALSRYQHTIFEDWLITPIDNLIFETAGYVCFQPIRISEPGTTKAWTHKSIVEDPYIYQQTPDHFHSVLQIAAYLIKYGFTDVKIHHWNDVDVSRTFDNITYAFEYERPKTHSISQLKPKFTRAKEKYNTVYIVCQNSNKEEVARAVEPQGVIKPNRISLLS